MWLTAPFDPATVDRINRAQAGVVADPVHPLVCPQARDGRHALAGGYVGTLVAHRQWLVCPTCGHVQSWLPAAVLRQAERAGDVSAAAQAMRIERTRQSALDDFRRLVRGGQLSAQPMVDTLEAMAPRVSTGADTELALAA